MPEANGNVSRKEIYEMTTTIRKEMRDGFKVQNNETKALVTVITNLRLEVVEIKTIVAIQEGEIATLRKRDWYAGGLGASAIYLIQYLSGL